MPAAILGTIAEATRETGSPLYLRLGTGADALDCEISKCNLQAFESCLGLLHFGQFIGMVPLRSFRHLQIRSALISRLAVVNPARQLLEWQALIEGNAGLTVRNPAKDARDRREPGKAQHDRSQVWRERDAKACAALRNVKQTRGYAARAELQLSVAKDRDARQIPSPPRLHDPAARKDRFDVDLVGKLDSEVPIPGPGNPAAQETSRLELDMDFIANGDLAVRARGKAVGRDVLDDAKVTISAGVKNADAKQCNVPSFPATIRSESA